MSWRISGGNKVLGNFINTRNRNFDSIFCKYHIYKQVCQESQDIFLMNDILLLNLFPMIIPQVP